jgi:hypothetical protein
MFDVTGTKLLAGVRTFIILSASILPGWKKKAAILGALLTVGSQKNDTENRSNGSVRKFPGKKSLAEHI